MYYNKILTFLRHVEYYIIMLISGNYIMRFTVEEDKIGKNKKKGTKGRQVLHSSFISNVTIEKGDIVMHTGNYPGRTISPDNILAHYLEIVKENL